MVTDICRSRSASSTSQTRFTGCCSFAGVILISLGWTVLTGCSSDEPPPAANQAAQGNPGGGAVPSDAADPQKMMAQMKAQQPTGPAGTGAAGTDAADPQKMMAQMKAQQPTGAAGAGAAGAGAAGTDAADPQKMMAQMQAQQATGAAGSTAAPGTIPMPGIGTAPMPGVGPPMPGVGPPMPGVGQPMPGVGQPMPGVGLPMPGVGQPMPGVGQPMPGVGLPMPGVGQPMPAGAGGHNQQAPSFEVGTAEYAAQKVVLQLLSGDYSGLDEFISPKCKGVLADIRDGKATDNLTEDLKKQFTGVQLLGRPRKESGATVLTLRNGEGGTITLKIKKEGDSYKVSEMTVKAGTSKKR